MIVTIVHVYAKEGYADDFIKASVINHENSIKEAGNFRFDVLQSREDPNKFILYEAYTSETAAKAHKETEHYLKWRQTVKEMMEKPREGVPYNVIAPGKV